jgi:hypothetical protein
MIAPQEIPFIPEGIKDDIEERVRGKDAFMSTYNIGQGNANQELQRSSKY